MADIKISALTELAASTIAPSDLLVGVHALDTTMAASGTTKKIDAIGLMSHLPRGSDLTIAGGAITPTHPMHRIDAEGAAASDDLDTINGGANGRILILATVNSARDVVIKHNTGNIRTPGGTDITLGEPRHSITFYYNTSLSAWQVLMVANA